MRLWVRSILLIGGALGYFAASAGAHGGGFPQITNVEAGPYWVSVWTQSSPLRVGEGHFTVAVSEPPLPGSAAREAGPPVLGATVELELTSLDNNGERLAVPATHENAVNKFFYEADLNLPAAGQWQVVISIQGPAGAGRTDFEIEVVPASSFPWILLAALGLLLLTVAWLVQSMRR